MKKIILLAALLTILSCTKDQERIANYYPNGEIEYEYFTKDDKIEGQYLQYYPSGKLQCVTYFENDLQHGSFKYYYENGNVYIDGQFSYDSPNGTYYYDDEKNNIDSIIEYVLRDNTKPTYDFFELDTITEEWAKNSTLYANQVFRFIDNELDSKKSLYAKVSTDSTASVNDSVPYTIAFSNPYEYYGYNPDSIEFIFFSDDYMGRRMHFSTKDPIRVTFLKKKTDSTVTFKVLILLKYDDGGTRGIYIKESNVPELILSGEDRRKSLRSGS